jgi:hypothetical protein
MPFEALRSPLPCCSPLCSSPLSRLDGRAADPPPMDDIAMVSEGARRARSRLGEDDYRLFSNNCEHFCNRCLSGVSHSAQVRRPLRLPLRVLGALFHA